MNTQSQSDWSEMFLSVYREMHQLPKEHRGLVYDIAMRIGPGFEPTLAQTRYLHRLLHYLDRKRRTA
jgi:hypothetical protein